ncbi:hypothetical protein [Bacillus sp. V5-8f]|uniref:hypothetical protein n=1 Tax=Bacillus sp. V5-8f TaxID=2053044 RepID=UPI0015E082EA|nr:hypothetical protein [Bacillus sp. V5-8f]
MSKQNQKDSNFTPETIGGEKVVISASDLAGLDDRTTLETNRSGDDLMNGTPGNNR